jgi:hypothetical protein
MNRAREGPAAGFGPDRLVMLEVTGRRTGRTISFPVVVADYQGERYLVSMLGQDTNWVRSMRTAGGRAVLRHGHREVVHLGEVDPGERAAILRQTFDNVSPIHSPGGVPVSR